MTSIHTTQNTLPNSDISLMMSPRSTALVGATDSTTSFGGRVFRQMTNFGYSGKIYPINPRLGEIHGMKCYPNIKDLPETPDHVGIIVSTERVFDVLADCASIGVKYATVFSGGFSETGTLEGRERQQRLIDFARASGMRLMGPNCNGIVNFVDAFAMTSTAAIMGKRAPAGDVGIVCHSGGLGQINVMWRAQEIGLGISYEASCGNEADLDALDFVRFMVHSESTKVILLAAETIKDGEKLRLVAEEAANLEKPIVVLKFGRTEAGSRAAASHTGAIVGDNDIYDALFRQYGMIRVHECNELYEAAVFLRNKRLPKGRGAASVAPTGGNIVQVADAGATAGLTWPDFSEHTQSELAKLLPGYGKVSNPTDMTSLATGNQHLYRSALTTIIEDPSIDVMIPIFASISKKDLEQGAALVQQFSKPAAMLWVGGCNDDPTFTPKDLVRAGIPVFRDATPCVRAIRSAADYGRFLDHRKNGRFNTTRPDEIDHKLAVHKLALCEVKITEREAKDILACYGLTITREALAKNEEQAVSIAQQFATKVALKIDSPDILHKTEADAIRLNLSDADSVGTGFRDVMSSAIRYAPHANINGVLVQEMAEKGLEMMLGVIKDPVFGPIIAVGLGGIFVEVFKDIAYRVAPVSETQANDMLNELKAIKMLDGVRGMAPRDRDAVVNAIIRLSWFAHDFKDQIAELDVNPLMVHGHSSGATVVDALIVRNNK